MRHKILLTITAYLVFLDVLHRGFDVRTNRFTFFLSPESLFEKKLAPTQYRCYRSIVRQQCRLRSNRGVHQCTFVLNMLYQYVVCVNHIRNNGCGHTCIFPRCMIPAKVFLRFILDSKRHYDTTKQESRSD